MNTSLRQWLTGLALASLCVLSYGAHAQNTEATPPPAEQTTEAPPADVPLTDAGPTPETPAAQAPAVATADEAVPQDAVDNQSARRRWESRWLRNRHWTGSEDDVVSVGGDSKLDKDHRADSVVSVFGSSTSEGDVSDAVVSVLGDTHVSGTVGDAAVSVLGDNYVNGKVFGDVVAVLGSVVLGPEAEVNGDVVVIGGTLTRDPKAIVNGGVQQVFGGEFGSFRWLRPWIQKCLLYGRPLALSSGLGWAWGLALGFLALYALIALLFRDAVDHCVQTLETRPGQTVVAALLGLLLTPVLFALLFITVIGIALVPFAGAGMFMATTFGKVVVLAWIGRRVSRLAGEDVTPQTALTVVIGGAIVLLLYVVPVIGFIVYKALGILGFGVAVYAVILAVKARRGESAPPSATAPPPPAGGGGSTAFSGEPYISPAAGGAAYAGAADTSASMAGAADSTASAFTSSAESAAAAGSTTADTASAGSSSTSSSASAFGAPNSTGAAAASTIIPSTLPRADFMVRMGALLIDVILVAVMLGVIHGSHQAQLIVLAVYGAIMWKVKGTTIGGIVFGLQVVRADGRPIDWSTAIVRALSCFLSLVVVGLGFIWIAFDDQRQGWHDKIAGTLVVRVPKGVSLL
jgi:uncharacterized RDD family membrane protein YckC